MDEVIELQRRLEGQANPKTKAWWERYLKGVIPFRGVKMADIRRELHAWLASERIPERYEAEGQLNLALTLLRQTYTEDKLAGILMLQEVLLPAGVVDWRSDLPRLARLYQDGHIYDWNTSDWFCVKVLGPMIEVDGAPCARAIAEWRHSHNLWQRRAAGVAFVDLAKNGDENFPGFTDILLEVCKATVSHPERFAQTGTGWALRELSLAEPERVAAFVEQHIPSFSSEGLRYAIAKLPEDAQERLRRLHREAATD
jgi:3-methyladenine DNA glycosylase AlkD